MSKPRLLDLFCGAGGCTKGYQRAGFYVVGVDLHPQPHYCGDEFYQADALEFPLDGFDAIHASPPCQAYTSMKAWADLRRNGAQPPALIEPVRERLRATGLPYVIENVLGAPLVNPIQLCGSVFGLGVRRHRLFECSFPMLVPPCSHGLVRRPLGVYGDHPEDSAINHRSLRPVFRAPTLEAGQEAMGIDWMPWKPLTQAIPPAYCEFIGQRLLEHLGVAA